MVKFEEPEKGEEKMAEPKKSLHKTMTTKADGGSSHADRREDFVASKGLTSAGTM
jgi:hypothetical protein